MKKIMHLCRLLFETKAASLCISLAIALSLSAPSHADNNSFFGSNAGGASSKTDAVDVDEGSGNAGLPGLNSTGIPGSKSASPAKAPAGDYTDDEKRMQKKYKGNMNRAKELIDKGDKMMKSSGNNAANKDYKKGKILKETGEKWLSDLKASDPFMDDKTK
jgi:hypothetical protein